MAKQHPTTQALKTIKRAQTRLNAFQFLLDGLRVDVNDAERLCHDMDARRDHLDPSKGGKKKRT